MAQQTFAIAIDKSTKASIPQRNVSKQTLFDLISFLPLVGFPLCSAGFQQEKLMWLCGLAWREPLDWPDSLDRVRHLLQKQDFSSALQDWQFLATTREGQKFYETLT